MAAALVFIHQFVVAGAAVADLPIGVPDPVGHGAVDQHQEHEAKHAVRAEGHPLGEGTWTYRPREQHLFHELAKAGSRVSG